MTDLDPAVHPNLVSALHEAGHAVVARAFGWRIDNATMTPPSATATPPAGLTDTTERLTRLLILAAGSAATERWGVERHGFSQDDEDSVRHAYLLAGDVVGAGELIALCRRIAALMLAHPDVMPQVATIAAALYECGTLSGRRIEEVLRRAR